jgi:YfiH family protein
LTAPIPMLAPDVGVDGVAIRVTTRMGGVSAAPYASLNLGDHVGDRETSVRVNRQRLLAALDLPSVAWLRQVHGCRVLQSDPHALPDADGQWTQAVEQPIAVLTADCLSVVIVAADASCVGVAHAGWRGLAGGVLQALVASMPVSSSQMIAWLGPAIGPAAYEVGPEVRAAFRRSLGDDSERCFAASLGRPGHFRADLFSLARLALGNAGVGRVTGGERCSHADAERFFSHRRDGPATGRFATLVWRVASA